MEMCLKRLETHYIRRALKIASSEELDSVESSRQAACLHVYVTKAGFRWPGYLSDGTFGGTPPRERPRCGASPCRATQTEMCLDSLFIPSDN